MARTFVDLPKAEEFDANLYFGVAVSFTLSQDFAVRADAFIEVFGREVDNDMSIRSVCPRHAFARTVREMETGRMVDRVHENSGRIEFQFTKEFYDSALGMKNYDPELRVSFDKGTEQISVTTSNVDHTTTVEIQQKLEEIYKTKSNYFFGTHIHTIIKRWMTKKCGLTRVGPNGLYFIPARSYANVIRLDGFVQRLTAGKGGVFVLPVAKTNRTREDIKFAFEEEAIAEINKLREELKAITDGGGDTTDRMTDTRMRKIRDGLNRVSLYEDVLGMQLSSIRQELETFKTEVQCAVAV